MSTKIFLTVLLGFVTATAYAAPCEKEDFETQVTDISQWTIERCTYHVCEIAALR